MKSLYRLAAVRVHSSQDVNDCVLSASIADSISAISNCRSWELSSPSASYLARMRYASSCRF